MRIKWNHKSISNYVTDFDVSVGVLNKNFVSSEVDDVYAIWLIVRMNIPNSCTKLFTFTKCLFSNLYLFISSMSPD